MDLISILPEPVVHGILYYLPTKDVVRTSCLSKTWRRIRSSYPTVNFIQRCFDRPSVFQEFMRNSLQSFIAEKSGVQRFTLGMSITSDEDNDVPELNYVISQWINYVANGRVEEVNIYINKKNTSDVQPLCSNVSAHVGILFASKTLITLRLNGCAGDELEKSSIIINLPHLRNLALESMDLDDTLLQNLVSGCPLLQDLTIESCSKLTSLEVSNLKGIKKIWVRSCSHLQRLEVRAPTLETFVFRGVLRACEVDLVACETSLKDVNLSVMEMTTQWLQDFISKFVCLESLFLYYIPNLETIKISSPKLKKFTISQCLDLGDGEATEIDAPLVHELDYSHNKLPFYNISTSNLQEVVLRFSLGDHDGVWFNTLKHFFRKTSHIQNFKVAVLLKNGKKDRVITHELTDSVFLVWEQLKHWNLDVLIQSSTPAYWIRDLFELSIYDEMYIAGHDEKSSSDLLRALEEELSRENMRAAADRAAFGKTENGLNKKCKARNMVQIVEVGRTNLAQANELKEEDEEEITSWIPLLKAYKTLYNNNITCVDLKLVSEPLFGCKGCLNCQG